jgi:hypothetical protein
VDHCTEVRAAQSTDRIPPRRRLEPSALRVRWTVGADGRGALSVGLRTSVDSLCDVVERAGLSRGHGVEERVDEAESGTASSQ